MTRIVGIVALLIVVMATASCASWPEGTVSTSSPKPEMTALAGHWQVVEKTQQPQPSGRKPIVRGRMILTPDGQVIFDNLPDFKSDATLSGPGNWSVVEDPDRGAWALSVNTSAGPREFFVTGAAPTYELVAIVGDPKDRKLMTLGQIR